MGVQPQGSKREAQREVRQEARASTCTRWRVAKVIIVPQETRWLLCHVGHLQGPWKEQLAVRHRGGRGSNLFAGSCLSPLSRSSKSAPQTPTPSPFLGCGIHSPRRLLGRPASRWAQCGQCTDMLSWSPGWQQWWRGLGDCRVVIRVIPA